MSDSFDELLPDITDDAHYLALAMEEVKETLPPPPLETLMHEIDISPEGIAPYFVIAFDQSQTMLSIEKLDSKEEMFGAVLEVAKVFDRSKEHMRVVFDPRHEKFEYSDDYGAIQGLINQLNDTKIPLQVMEMNHYDVGYAVTSLNYGNKAESKRCLPEEYHSLSHFSQAMIQLLRPKVDAGEMGLDEMLGLMRLQYATHRHEEMHVIYLKEEQVLDFEKVKVGTENAIAFTKEEMPAYLDKLANTAKKLGADRVMEVHNHPYGAAQPSPADYRTHFSKTSRLSEISDVYFDSAIIGPYGQPYVFSRDSARLDNLEDMFYW